MFTSALMGAAVSGRKGHQANDAGKLPTQLWMNGQLNVSHADLLLPMNTGTFASQPTIDCSCIRAFWIVSGDMFDAPHPKG
jgi:hypothetical protein